MVTYVVIALIVGAALALAVAVANSSPDASGVSVNPTEASVSGVSSDAGEEGLAVADPAKERPLLDKFTPKDPFIPLASTAGGGSSTANSTVASTSSSSPTSNLSAKVKVDGTSYNVMEGDKVPGGSAAEFTVAGVTASDVTFKVIDGSLENGDKSFTVNLGEAVRVTLESGVSYDLSVTAIGASSTGGGSGGGSSTTTAGHSISVLSIISLDGAGLVTIKVDGKTYVDKRQGDVITTSWGQIEIVSIDVGGQTVTTLHGDQTLTLHAGQVVVK